MISIKFLLFWEAPPIKKPSIEPIFDKFLMFLGFTEPPYKTLFFLSLFFFIVKLFIYSMALLSSFDLGILPDPIDQIGS